MGQGRSREMGLALSRCGPSHSPGNSPNCKGGHAHNMPFVPRFSVVALLPKPFTPRRKKPSMERILSPPAALEATSSCLRQEQARVDGDFGEDQKEAEFPRKSGDHFRLAQGLAAIMKYLGQEMPMRT